MQSVKDTDAESGLHYKAPRVSLADIEGAIAAVTYIAGDQVLHRDTEWRQGVDMEAAEGAAGVFTMCLLILRNGWVVVGKSAPASPENFDAEYGKKLAYEDAVRQIWPLMGFSLKDKLHARSQFGTGGQ